MLGPVEHCRADRLAGAHDAAQFKRVARARLRNGFHHHLERCREEKAVSHAVLAHKGERALGFKTAAIAEDGSAEVERRKQRVHESAGPGPIRG